MRKFKIHFKEISHVSQIVEAESLDAAMEAWREQGYGVWEEKFEELETGDPHRFEESVDGEWKEVTP